MCSEQIAGFVTGGDLVEPQNEERCAFCQLTTLQLRLSIAEAQERNARLHVKVEKTRVLLQEKKSAALSASIPLEEARAEVRRLKLQYKQTELAVKDKELELASSPSFESASWALPPAQSNKNHLTRVGQ